MADITENLFDAIQILVDKSIAAVKFDQTINATIVDASKAKNGKYVVSTGTTKFTAYSSNTEYKEKDAVMVTIPQGNYDNEKIIIGKAIRDAEEPLVYQSPFETMINLTNNIISDYIPPVSFWANSQADTTQNGWQQDIPNGYAWTQDIPFSQSQTYYNENANFPGCVWDSGDISYQGYQALGLQAQFSTWLAEYSTALGNYGLMLEITFENADGGKQVHSCQLDSDDFFGDVYNYETYYTQEQVFDISEYSDMTITHLRLFPYQRCNFKTMTGENVPTFDAGDFSDIPPNIFIKDFLICLGSYRDTITQDTAELLTESKLTYTKNYTSSGSDKDEIRAAANKKIIQLRWIHLFENEEIKVVTEDEFPEGYEVRWYRAKDGAQSPDEFAGAHWVRYFGDGTMNISTGDYAIDNPANDIVTNHTQLIFNPNVNHNNEKIKVIIIKIDINNNTQKKIVATNVLEFTNEQQIRDSVTFEDISALTLRVDDDFHGNYLLYNRSGKLGKNEWNTEYSITALFEGQPLAIEDCSLVEWAIPTENTMIHGYKSIEGKVNKIFYYINDILNNNATNNTISLKIIKDGLEYAAVTTLRFGTAGTNGSNYTMALIWDDNKKAINVQPKDFTIGARLSNADKEKYALKGTLWLYDQSGSPVDLSSATIEATWETAANCNLLTDGNAQNNNYIFENEEENIFYPVFFKFSGNDYSATNNSCWSLIDYFENEGNRQPHTNGMDASTFYCFIDNEATYDSMDDTNITNGNYYYYYDLEEQKFKPWKKRAKNSNELSNQNLPNSCFIGPLYRKRLNDNEKKKKITFKAIPVTADGANNTMAYSFYRRYFIKYNDQFILDPWDGYQENETYYEPILAPAKIQDSLNNGNSQLNVSVSGQRITIDYNKVFDNLNYIYILKIKITNFGDYPLEMYKPIALTRTLDTNNLIINYINGAEDVRYATTGETDFNKNPYEIEATKIKSDNSTEIEKYSYEQVLNSEQTQVTIQESNYIKGYWRLLIAENYNKWYQNSENNQFYPSLKETALEWIKQPSNNSTYNVQQTKAAETKTIEDREWNVYRKPVLKPPALYYKDAAPYAVQFLRNDTKVLWTQPIFVYQDNYPSTTLNQWNGKDIITDNDAGTVVANGFAAGHKNGDNTFSGVVLGDWSRTDIDRSFAVEETGVYGFNHGAMSYALKDDGTAFFGKDGRGRIYIDGNNATIKSASWRYDKPEGMMIDLDDGILQTRNSNYAVKLAPGSFEMEPLTEDGNTIKLNTNGNTLFEIKKGNKPLINIGSNYYLQSEDFNTTQNAESGTQINLTNGKITSYNLDLTGYNIENNVKRVIQINSKGTYDNDYPLRIGVADSSNFLVKWDGTLIAKEANISGKITATTGEIGGWKIGSKTLRKDTVDNDEIEHTWVRLQADPGNYYKDAFGIFKRYQNISGNWTDTPILRIKYDGTIIHGSDGNSNFELDGSTGNITATGTITATSGSIGKWNIKTVADDDGSLSKTVNNNRIDLGGATKAIWVNGKFIVDYDGTVSATAGTIGGWTIGNISGGGNYLHKTKSGSGTVNLGDSDYAIDVNDGVFKVRYNGALTATSATITGDIKANNYYMKENTNYTQFFTHTMPIITEFKCTSDGTLISVKATTVKVVCAGAVGNAYQIYPRPAGGGCFVAGTKITMANGIYQNIENIKENDLVLVYDENNNKFVIDKVIKLLIHHNTNQLMTLILEDGTKIKSTLSHPFLTVNGWKTIDLKMAFKEHSILCQKIKIGDILIGQKHNAKIIDIKYEQCPMNYDTYNIFIKKYHTYIANNYVVHNSWTINKD